MYNFNLNFNKINLCWRETQQDAFENLCKEFIASYYNITENINLVECYTAIECPVILWNDWLYYWFQSKLINSTNTLNALLKKSFLGKGDKCKMEDDDYNKIDKLIIFSNKEKTKNTDINLKSWIKKEGLIIEYRCGENFKNELQKDSYITTTITYFNNDEIRKKLHKEHKKKWIVKSIWNIGKIQVISDYQNTFEWDYITVDEKNVAKEYQEIYLINKFLYCDTSSFQIFSELEKKIVDYKFRWLDLHYRTRYEQDMEWVLDRFVKELSSLEWSDKIDMLAYMPQQENKKWLLIDYWAEWYCKIAANEKMEVRFISTKTWWTLTQ